MLHLSTRWEMCAMFNRFEIRTPSNLLMFHIRIYYLTYRPNFFFFFFFFFLFFLNHYAPVSQANWCNMTFTAGNLFPSHSCIGWPKSSPHRDLNPGPQIERQITYQLSYPSLHPNFFSDITDHKENIDGVIYWQPM